MELATNSFNKGLLMDTHPLVLGNDTLSDCLNGTFITMNGNEVILLNDMGNRRIDHAYLPAGYEPVGIKEHGGIIYLALYNPITHKGLVGSFPSPERRIGEENSKLGGKFTLADFINEGKLQFKIVEIKGNETITHNIKYLKDDVLLIPLSSDTSLHAGDKFTVHSLYIWGTENDGNGNLIPVRKYLTDFGHKDSKNNLFTLSLGVMNSLNEFINITNSLLRFKKDGNEEVIISNPTDDDYGYFIQESFSNPSETQDDNELLRQRNALAINTYAYKLVGPLYLKAELNHISNFSYSIEYEKFEEENHKYLRLYISGNFLYNCPDPSNNTLFDFYYKNSNSDYNLAEPESINITFSEEVNNLGLYSGEFLKVYKILYSLESDIIKYFLGVRAFTSDYSTNNDYYYIESLSDKGEIDISKVNSDLCSLIGYRFKNNINNDKIDTILTLEFECYPNRVTTFEDLSIQFTNVENEEFSFTLPQDLYQSTIKTGKLNILISWNNINGNLEQQNIKVSPRELYNVTISWKKKNNNDFTSVTKSEERFFLSTELFNECYNESSGEYYVRDFKIFRKNYQSNDLEKIIINKYLTIKTELLNNINIETNLRETTEGLLFKSIQREFSISLLDINDNPVFTTAQFISNKSIPEGKNPEDYIPDFYIIKDTDIDSNYKLLKVKFNKLNWMRRGYEFGFWYVKITRKNQQNPPYTFEYIDNEEILRSINFTSSTFSILNWFDDGYQIKFKEGDELSIMGVVYDNEIEVNLFTPELYKKTTTLNLKLDCSNLSLGISNLLNYPENIGLNYSDLSIGDNLEKEIIINNSSKVEIGEVSNKDEIGEDYNIPSILKDNKTYNCTINSYHYFKPSTYSNKNISINKLYVNINSDLGRKEIFGTKRFNEIENLGIDIKAQGFFINDWESPVTNKAFCTHCSTGELFTGDWESTSGDSWIFITSCLDSALKDNGDEGGWLHSLKECWEKLKSCISSSSSIIKYSVGTLERFFCNNPGFINIDRLDNAAWTRVPLTTGFKGNYSNWETLSNKTYIHVFLADETAGGLVLLNNDSDHHPGLFVLDNGNDLTEKEITKFLGTDKDGNPYVIPVTNPNTQDILYVPSNENCIYTDSYSYDIIFTIQTTATNLQITGQKLDSYIMFNLKDGESNKTSKKISYNINSDPSFKLHIESILNTSGITSLSIYFNTGEPIDLLYPGISVYKNGKLMNIEEKCPLRYLSSKDLKIVARLDETGRTAPNCTEIAFLHDFEYNRRNTKGALGVIYKDIPIICKTDLI